MDQETSEALELSIQKWEGIVAGTRCNKGTSDCALCALYHPYKTEMLGAPTPSNESACERCPVKAHTGVGYCLNTPFNDYIRVRLPEYKDVEREEAVYQETRKAHAKAEVKFLISLREPESE